jgi:lipid-binding SYLF domain-containing protein
MTIMTAARRLRVFVVVAFAIALTACVSGDNTADKRANVQKMRADTLAKLYQTEPSSREHVANAVGYGVFSNVGVNLILLSAGGGWGVVHDNRSGRDTYMNMGTGGIGLGLGVKDFRGVFVFTSPGALDQFVTGGWDGSAQADAAAVATGKGGAWAGAVDVAPGIKLYQMTENGLALQATVQGTKYWKDDELN